MANDVTNAPKIKMKCSCVIIIIPMRKAISFSENAMKIRSAFPNGSFLSADTTVI